MVLSTLADIIYNLYLLIYYVLKTCAFIGYLLIDIVHHVSWLIKNAYDFCTVVYEDNRYFIQDLKSVVVGTADFFINNIATAYSASRSICENLSKTVAALLNFSNFIFNTAKQGLVLIGEAVWFLFTLPAQLVVLCFEFAVFEATQLKNAANALLMQLLGATTTLVHYTTHDVPLEAACGLGLLVLAYFCPSGIKIALRFMFKAAYHLYRLLHPVVQKFLSLMNAFKDKMRSFVSTILESNDGRNPLLVVIIRLCHGLHAHAAVIYDMLTSIYNMSLIRANDQRMDGGPAVRARRRETPNRSTIGLCIICEDNERSVAFVPCGHICACKVCSIHLCYHNPVCPLCRSYIQQKLEIYL
uniref:RING-type domain-containing protein n=1 Tax=Anopheles atroparvus TaxID=41427 RepID=A0AAG5DBA1_ANOAO